MRYQRGKVAYSSTHTLTVLDEKSVQPQMLEIPLIIIFASFLTCSSSSNGMQVSLLLGLVNNLQQV